MRPGELLQILVADPEVIRRRPAELSAAELLIDALDGPAASAINGGLVADQKLLLHTASDSVAAAFTELIALAARAHTKRRAPPSSQSSPSTTPPTDEPSDEPTPGVRELLPLVALLYSLAGAGAVGSALLEEHEQRLRETLLQVSCHRPRLASLYVHSTLNVRWW